MKKRTTPVIRIRPAGGVYILLSIVLGVISVNSGNNLLYLVTALLLGYMLASGVAGRHNVMGAEAWAELPDEIYAGRAFPLVVKVRNRRRFASLHLIEVAVSPSRKSGGVLQGPVRAFFAVVPSGAIVSRSVWVTLPRRGWEALALELSSAYPFDFFVRWGRASLSVEALVFPAPLFEGGKSFWDDKEDSGGEEEPFGAMPLDASDVAGIRPYEAGDPINRIHWKLSARTGKLSTRLFEGQPPRPGRTIDLDALVENGAERGLSIAAGRIVEAEREDVPLGMKDRGVVIPPASGRAARLGLLERLALYEPVLRGEAR
mgnify:CR=1 FL=1